MKAQAEFGAAIGVTRQTIGRMERGEEPITRRTELAMRYIAEVGPQAVRPLATIHQEVADVLDKVSVRGCASIDDMRQLRASTADWRVAGGSVTALNLLQTVEGAIGIMNATPVHSPLRSRCSADFLDVKRAWRAIRRDISQN